MAQEINRGQPVLQKKCEQYILKCSSVYALYKNAVDKYRSMSIDKLIRIDYCTFAALLTHSCIMVAMSRGEL